MSGKSGKKRRGSETLQDVIKKRCIDAINFLKKQEFNKLSIEKTALTETAKRNEQLELEILYKESAYMEMKKKLAAKSKELDEKNEKYEKSWNNFCDLDKKFVQLSTKYCSLEQSYEKDRLSLNNQLEQLIEQITTMETLMCAKEAECAAYLTDMQAKLEEVDVEKAQLEREVFEIKCKMIEIENLNEKAAAEKQNILELYEVDTAKLQKKVDKKTKRIESLEIKFLDMETENKELKNALEIQQHKIHQLRCVLNRPFNRSSPILEGGETEQRPTTQVEPTMVFVGTSSSSSRPATPELNVQIIQATSQQISDQTVIVNHLSTTTQHNNINISQNQREEVVNISAPIQVEQNFESNVNASRLSGPLHGDEMSDDMLFPSYVPKQNRRSNANADNNAN